MAVELWSKSGSSSTVVSTGGIPISTTTPGQTTVTNTVVGNISVSSGSTSVVGNYQIITFTGSGSFTPTASGNVELMLIGGGGGGVSTPTATTPGASSGGIIFYGSQSYRFSSGTSITLAANTTYTVTIGGGGAVSSIGTNGTNSTVVGGSINLTAYGGGRPNGTGAAVTSGFHGPGAGASYYGTAWGATGAAAPNQGYNGVWGGWAGLYGGGSNGYYFQCGGSGLGSPGAGGSSQGNDNVSDLAKGQGGQGFYTDISGTFAYYGAGGGGGVNRYDLTGCSSATAALGGGGVSGGAGNSGVGTAASPNTGSGGAGASIGSSGVNGTAGGSGICIVRIPIYSITPDAVNAIQQNAVALGNTASGGNSITYTGNYRVHTFTASGSFTAQHTGYIQYLIVAGGGGGCAGYRGSVGGSNGGSGGAGGYLEYYQSDNEYGDLKGPRLTVTTGDIISVVIGGGGTAGSYGSGVGTATPTTNGSGSYLYNNTTKQYVYSLGGGGGGCGVTGAASLNTSWDGAGLNQGKSGGSGGGGAWITPNETSGNDDSNLGGGGIAQGWPVQGYNGSNGSNSQYGVGGGAGGAASGSTPGPGRAATITGASVTYAAGGPRNTTATATNATANTGNGGQGGNYQVVGQTNPGSAGGSGIVIIRYRFQ